MDKYEYNLKLEEIDKLVDQGDYEEAAAMADTIDWRRVRNVRTLCLISEIYEAANRYEESKNLLVRAYRKSPVGRNVLYRLVEVTTALGQYDEALEYYSEYVQAAPHDNNRYILKYNIYKGRGSSDEELIEILEEYLGQEYTERWAYELAELYYQTGQTQKCQATCDDLVLWFHTGKYVKKALELKRRFSVLTPRQQQIYENCLQEEAQTDYLDEEEEEASAPQDQQNIDEDIVAENIMAETEKKIAGEVSAHKAEEEKVASEDSSQTDEQQTGAKKAGEAAAAAGIAAGAGIAAAAGAASGQEDHDDSLQVELAKSVRQIISGVAKKPEMNEDDVPAAVEDRIQNMQKIEIPPQPEPVAEQLSIDDVLLSMGENGQNAGTAGMKAEDMQAEDISDAQTAETAAQGEAKAPDGMGKSVAQAQAEELTDEQLEALQYTNNPEHLLKNRNSLPTYTADEDLDNTREIVNTKEELQEAARQELLSKETIRIPTEEVSKVYAQDTRDLNENLAVNAQDQTKEEAGIPQPDEAAPAEETAPEEEEAPAEEEIPSEETAPSDEEIQAEETAPAEEVQAAADEAESGEAAADEEEEYEEPLQIPDYLRGFFNGFTEVEGLEDQIENAILQVEAKGDDRTSRTGNILIFGAHRSGKTTVATGIAKAVALEKGSSVAKMAKIYAADLNRKDIAATIAKIAGGTLIIEEAGDLEPNIVEQLTTAMEFRTDGLVIILEDEQKYVHELLMQHPRFTMKFTAQIYLPDYTAEELAMFAQEYAQTQDFKISDEGLDAVRQIVTDAASTENPMTLGDVSDLVDKAIHHSNKLFRKMSMGKKRYDEQDYILLFAKDF